MIYIDADIWRLSDEELEAQINRLPEQRREVCLGYRHSLGRRQALFSYLLLCQGLQQEYGICQMPDFTYGEHGKPFLSAHPDIHFNISHCRHAVACALSNQPIGIDIESIRSAKQSVIDYAMNEQESLLIRESDDPDRAFTRLWTQKEALLKYTGQGINESMKDVLLCVSNIELETTETDDYILSVCRPR